MGPAGQRASRGAGRWARRQWGCARAERAECGRGGRDGAGLEWGIAVRGEQTGPALGLGRVGGKRELGRRGRGWAAHGPRGGKEMGRQVWAAWVGLLRFGPDGSVSTGWAREKGLGGVWVFLFYF